MDPEKFLAIKNKDNSMINTSHKKSPKNCTDLKLKIYLHRSKIVKARPGLAMWPEYPFVQSSGP